MNHPFDPVRLHFLDALAKRTQVHQGAVKGLLEEKLSRARAAYHARLDQATPTPSGLRLQTSALAELTRTLTQHVPKNGRASADDQGDQPVVGYDASVGSRPELKSMRYFRETWAKLSVEKQLAQAIAQAPENAGPLNSHQLVLRSLSLMRGVSPAYLNRFMSYADALLWLDQADQKPAAKNGPAGDVAKKRKLPRTGSR